MRRLGLLIGHEDALIEALLERLGSTPGVEAELVEIGGVPEQPIIRYDVILDRFNHAVPHYRYYLDAAIGAGVAVINNPRQRGNPFTALSMLRRHRVAVPRAMLLPQRLYGPDVIPDRSLRNVQFPLDWQAIAQHVGFPAIFQELWGGPEVAVGNTEALIAAFDAAQGGAAMVRQAWPSAEHHNCLRIGDVVFGGDDACSALMLQIGEQLGLEVHAATLVCIDGQHVVTQAWDPFPALDPTEQVVTALVRLLATAGRR